MNRTKFTVDHFHTETVETKDVLANFEIDRLIFFDDI